MSDHPQHKRCILWDDPTIEIQWPFDGMPILSEKDRKGVTVDQCGVVRERAGGDLSVSWWSI